MPTRAVTPDDLPALTALWRADDVHFFGTPEHDEDEVREELDRLPSLDGHTVAIDDGDELVAAGWWVEDHTVLLAAHRADRADLLDRLVRDAVDHGALAVYALDRDTDLVGGLLRRGWRYTRSAFDLVRPVTADWRLADPVWPDGVVLRPAGEDDLRALHRLVYDEAGWAEVPGHVRRGFDVWRQLFVVGPVPLGEQVVAWRGQRPVGVAMSRTFSDGTGWVGQLAVARDERRHGLGRALLLEALRRRRDAGATQLGLGVSAANTGALALYESVGLRIEREFRAYVPPAAD